MESWVVFAHTHFRNADPASSEDEELLVVGSSLLHKILRHIAEVDANSPTGWPNHYKANSSDFSSKPGSSF